MFGVAMTLLVIDIRLPEAFDPKSGTELLHAVCELKSKFLVYLITFFVVGLRWLGNSKLAPTAETVTEQFARWTLLHLFLITCLPFSTMLIGRYDDLAPGGLDLRREYGARGAGLDPAQHDRRPRRLAYRRAATTGRGRSGS